MARPTVNLDDILAFDSVSELGSFTRAGERLGASKSIISRRVSRLEAQLGARLLIRGANGATLTQVGRDYRRLVRDILARLEVAHEAVHAAVSQVAGPIRLAAPGGFGASYLGPVLAVFLKANPAVEIDLVLEERGIDPIAEGFDLAIHIGELQDSSLVCRRLSPIGASLVASPHYLAERGAPAHPLDLLAHDALLYAPQGHAMSWRFHLDGRWQGVAVRGRFQANNSQTICDLAAEGLGVAAIPHFAARDMLADGRLQAVLADWPLMEYGLYAVMPPSRGATAKIRALVDHLAVAFRSGAGWNATAPEAIENRRLPTYARAF